MPAGPDQAARPRGRFGAGVLALAGVLTAAVNYGLVLLMTHGLAVDQYADFAGATAVLTTGGLVGSVGVVWVLARAVRSAGDDLARRRRVISAGFWMNGAIGLGFTAVSAAVTGSFAAPASAAVVGATMFVLTVGATGLGVLQGDGRTQAMGVVLLVEAAVKVVVAAGAVFVLGGGAPAALSGSLVGAGVLLVTLWPLRGMIGAPSAGLVGHGLWVESLRLTGVQTAVGLVASADVLLAALPAFSPQEAGTYQVASALGKTSLYVAAAMGAAVFPTLSAPGHAQRREQALRRLAVIAAAVVLLLVTLPPQVLHWVFPAAYAGVRGWLPLTAVLGAELAVLTLLAAFVQAEPPSRRVALRSVGLLVLVALLAVGAWAVPRGMVRVLGTCAVLVAAAGCVLMGSTRAQRPVVAAAARGLGRPRTVAAAVLAGAVLAGAGRFGPLWVPAACVVTVCAALVAFPEFRITGGGRSAADPPRQEEGLHDIS